MEQQESTVKELREALTEKAGALKKAQENELALLKEKRQLQDAKEALQLEVQRTLDEERGKLKEQAKAQADEENRLKIAEKEKVISDLKKNYKKRNARRSKGLSKLKARCSNWTSRGSCVKRSRLIRLPKYRKAFVVPTCLMGLEARQGELAE